MRLGPLKIVIDGDSCARRGPAACKKIRALRWTVKAKRHARQWEESVLTKGLQ